MRRLLLALILALIPATVSAQAVLKGSTEVPPEAIAIRCLNADGTSLVACGSGGAGGGGTEFAEDTAHTSGDLGPMILCVRKDTATALAGTDGDYIPCIVDASGRLWVNGQVTLVDSTGANMFESGVGLKATLVTIPEIGGRSASAGVAAYPNCTGSAPLRMTTATTSLLVAVAPASQHSYICHIRVVASGTTAVTFKEGTQSTTPCDTSTATLDGPYDLTAQTGFSAGGGNGIVLRTATAARQICVTSSAAVGLTIYATYAQY